MSNYREAMPLGICHHHIIVRETESEVNISSSDRRDFMVAASSGSPDASWFVAAARDHNNAENRLLVASDWDGQRGGAKMVDEVVKTNQALPSSIIDPYHEEHTKDNLSRHDANHGFVGWLWMKVLDVHR